MAESRVKGILEWLHHAYWIREFLLSTGIVGTAMAWIGRHVHIPADQLWPLRILCVGALMYLFACIRKIWQQRRPSEQRAIESATGQLATGRKVSEGFNIDEYFRVAYYSPLQTEVEQNFRTAAHEKHAQNTEAFYLKVISTGLVAIIHDQTWWPIFRSQLLALLELNKKRGMLPAAEMKKFYDAAAAEYPKDYADDTFDRWLGFLQSQKLLLRHPSEMVEITQRGKDFLKYLLHWGRGPETKRL